MLSDTNEKELIRRCRKNDREAFNELVLIYQNKVINIAYGMLSNKDDAYDAAQETFLKVYRYLDKFEEKSSFSTWIYRITVNVCNDILRKRSKTAPTISIFSGKPTGDQEPAELEIKDSSPTPEDHAESTETQALVRAALDELSEEFKTVITLFDLEGLSYDEIASIIKCPVGTVKSRLNRARNALKKKLSQNRELFL